MESDWPSGIKKTKQRVAVLLVLKEAEKPLSAFDIALRAGGEGESTWLSTVYRSLELFEKKAVVSKITLMDRDVALYSLNREEHGHFAICVQCHRLIEMKNCPMEAFEPLLADEDFRVVGHRLELFGYCRECEGDEIK